MSPIAIEIDEYGYPTLESMESLRKAQCDDSQEWQKWMAEVLDAVAVYFNDCGFGRARRRGNVWRFATGGWSGCEDALASLPPVVEVIAWRSSHRGGLHWYALGGERG